MPLDNETTEQVVSIQEPEQGRGKAFEMQAAWVVQYSKYLPLLVSRQPRLDVFTFMTGSSD
jgi:hypothetical protein